MFSNLGRHPEKGLPGNMVTVFLILGGSSIMFTMVAVPVYISTSSGNNGSFFLHNCSSTCFSLFFVILTILRGVRWCLFVGCISLAAGEIKYIFICLLAIDWYILLGEMSVQVRTFLNWS